MRWSMDFDSKEAEAFLQARKHKASTPMGKALIRAATPVKVDAIKKCPKSKHGPTLFRTIDLAVDESGTRHNVFVGTPLNYGLFQELGFTHWGSGAFIKNAYLVPAVNENKQQVAKNLAEEIPAWLLS